MRFDIYNYEGMLPCGFVIISHTKANEYYLACIFFVTSLQTHIIRTLCQLAKGSDLRYILTIRTLTEKSNINAK